MKYKTPLFWLLTYAALFIFLEYGFRFHFYFYEQKYLFLFSGDYACQQIARIGGAAGYLAAFLVQFFIYPYAGSAITAALLTATGVLTQQVVKRIFPHTRSFFLYLLPPAALLLMHFDFNYYLQGTVAYLFMLTAIGGYTLVKTLPKRIMAGAVLIPVLYISAGPVALLFALTVLLWEGFSKQPGTRYVFLLLVEAVAIALATVYFSFAGEFRFVLLPDAYYHSKLTPGWAIYFSWIILPCIVIFAFKTRKREVPGKKRYVWHGMQAFLLAGLLYWALPKYADLKSMKMKELDYYARTEQWDRIEQLSKGRMTNYLYLNYLNLALSNRHKLGDAAFAYDQKGPLGLQVNWNKSVSVSTLLSDIYFSTGAIGLSQEMAFEGFVGESNPRLLKRLIQTNLIFGAYPVAEKYISVLEKTLYYRKWATAQRAFLYQDSAVEKDPLLGAKRKCLPAANSLALMRGIGSDLTGIAESNPEHTASIHFLGVLHLLGKDLTAFRAIVEKYYTTPVLAALPVSFQEAVIVYSESDPDYWKKHGVTEATVARYRAYKKMLLQNKGRSDIRQVMAASFGNTFWYYLMFK